jgi:H+-transporting ATPase
VASAQAAIKGLTVDEVRERLGRYGPNEIPEEQPRLVRLFLRKLWAPVPWMLEITFVLEVALGRFTQAVIIAGLLLLNAALSFFQENRARSAVRLLRQRLAILVRAFRDGRWARTLAQDLVPGDVIYVRVGDLVPADMRILDGLIVVDQSTLTGESTPAEVGPGSATYAGSVVQRGEATAEVTSTGRNTYYGKTAELVHGAAGPGQLEKVIFTIVRYLVAIDVVLVVAVLVYALTSGLQFFDILPFTLILLVASVPVALPATYTLAGALGSVELAHRGVLVTRLSAIEEAAGMDVLCCDKTGTLTQNSLTLVATHVHPPSTENEVLRLAALASDDATQDPIDLAILAAARSRDLLEQLPQRLQFLPFDPATKRSEALVREGDKDLRIVKGATLVVASLASCEGNVSADADRFAAQGCRVLAVAAGSEGRLRLAGLLALQDPPRADSAALVRGLEDLGVRVVMVTGDGLATAQAVAAQVAISGRACPADAPSWQIDGMDLNCGVFAGVLPEHKFRLVAAFQEAGHVVGMTGDGVNDAPALKQAEIGVAVANATDVAKAAASLVLTRPGLGDLLAAVETGRRIYQRMLTYTLNKIVKTIQVAFFLSLGLLLTGDFVTTPRLILLLLFANDFVTMSLAADRVSFSRKPDHWRVRPLALSAVALALAWLVFSFAVLYIGREVLNLELPGVQTLVFVMLVFTGQANVYLVRERRSLWRSPPGSWLAISSIVDVIGVTFLATQGILMSAISPVLVFGLLASVMVYLFVLDVMKVRLFGWLKVR